MKSLNSLQPVGLLALRLALGIIFFSHGYPKLAHQGAGMQAFFVQHGCRGISCISQECWKSSAGFY